MDDETDVGLVVSHPESRRCDQCFDVVGPELIFEVLAFVGGESGRVRSDVMPLADEEPGETFRFGDGEGVHDPGPRKVAERVSHPRVPLRRCERWLDAEAQRCACEAAAQHDGVGAQLCRNVGGDTFVRRGRRREDGCGGVQPEQDVRQALVVGTEVVSPIADAVRFVLDEQAAVGQQVRQCRGELRVRETFRRHEQRVEFVGAQCGEDVVPVVDVRRVDGGSVQPSGRGRSDLVSHQRQQRRHDQRASGTVGTQRVGRRPVHRRLPPAGCLHHQDTPLVADQFVHGGTLIVPGCGTRPGHRSDGRVDVWVAVVASGGRHCCSKCARLVAATVRPMPTHPDPPGDQRLPAATGRRRTVR
jgi:hypothetical protein